MIRQTKYHRMEQRAMSVPLHRVRVNEVAHRSGKPQKWLVRSSDGTGDFAYKRRWGRPGESWYEYAFTDPDTAFMFSLHFGGLAKPQG